MSARKVQRIGSVMLALPILVGVAYFGGVAFTSIVPAAWASWSANVDRIQAENARIAKVQNAAEESVYANVCGAYFDASFISRQWSYRDLSWCKDYEDRMPN